MATTAVKSRPILFSGSMIRALLDGSKTQTRRIVKPQPPETATNVEFVGNQLVCRKRLGAPIEGVAVCPYGIGDGLWVRETFITGYETDDSGYLVMTDEDGEELPEKVWYRATESPDFTWLDEDGYTSPNVPWKPSIHMPRWASRITLRVTSVRVERLQEISEADAIAEGVDAHLSGEYSFAYREMKAGRANFLRLWDSINGASSWAANPWVWVVGFERIKPKNP